MVPEPSTLDFEVNTTIATQEFLAALMSHGKRRSDPRDLQQVLMLIADLDRIMRH